MFFFQTTSDIKIFHIIYHRIENVQPLISLNIYVFIRYILLVVYFYLYNKYEEEQISKIRINIL